MSAPPEHNPANPQSAPPQQAEPVSPNDVSSADRSTIPDQTPVIGSVDWLASLAAEERFSGISTDIEPRLLFQSFSRSELQPPPRTPHLGHLCLLGMLTLISALGVGLLVRVALHFHLYGVAAATEAVSDIPYMLGSMAALYLLTFVAGALIFPLFWHKSLFAGLHWRVLTAVHLRRRLFAAACLCFVLALLNGVLLPGPPDTPIDKIFRTPGAAWLLFFFGITFAPFFEEIVFRGFLLPALCTAYDWAAEQVSGEPSRGSDENGHPLWSIPAMIAGSILTSVPFALMHGEQTSYALGPLLLLVCVSLVLCWARLSTRSLAASVLVHACYNFLLFFLMLLGTGGFRHLDKM
jgi:membrane protease YdiL (CAAX protease family)